MDSKKMTEMDENGDGIAALNKLPALLLASH